jgi:hypothetical protein
MAAPHVGVAKFGVQAGYHFSGTIGRIAVGSIEPSPKGTDGFVDPVGRAVVLPALQMLGRQRSEGPGGLAGQGAYGHDRTLGKIQLTMVPHW